MNVWLTMYFSSCMCAKPADAALAARLGRLTVINVIKPCPMS